MASLPLALSIHHFISSVGADAGFAALIGLAILILLYFAQARETSNLRDHAAEAAERIDELEEHISALYRAGSSAQAPAQAPAHGAAAVAAAGGAPGRAAEAAAVGAGAVASRAVASRAGAALAIPFAPAGVAAPALAAATRLIPIAVPGIAPAPAAVGASVAAGPVAAGPVATSPVIPAGPPPIGAGAPMAAGAAVADRPAAATFAGGNATRPVPARPGADGGAGFPRNGAGAGAGTGAGRGGTQPPRPPLRASSGAARQQPRGRVDSGRGRAWLVPLLGILVLAAIVVIVIAIAGGVGGTSTTTATQSARTTPRTRTSTSSAVNPATVTVDVLNGTTVNGLAHTISAQLSSLGYKQGTTETATDQTRTATVVAYLPGHQRDAVAVAKSLKLPSTAVQPVDSASQAVACPPPGACTADVIVTAGSDLAAVGH